MLDDPETDTVATTRLEARSALPLAQFIVSLRHAPEPLGEHIRTFLLADDASACAAAIGARIDALKRRAHHRKPPSFGPTLDYLLDDIEHLVLPIDSPRALALLVEFIECDGAASESAGNEDWDIQQAFGRAIALLSQVAPRISGEDREQASARLLASDSYGLRVGVREALGRSPEPDEARTP